MIRYINYDNFFYSDSFRFDIHTVQFDEPDFEFHRHTFSEMVIILKGFGTHITDFGSEQLYSGDVFVFNGDMGHGFSGAEGLLVCNIIYDPQQILQSIDDDIQTCEGFQALFTYDPMYLSRDTFHSHVQLSVDNLIQLESMLALMQLEFATQKDGFQTMVLANFMRVVVFLSRLYQDHGDRRKLHELSGVIEYINTHYLESVTVTDLADVASLSVSHFMRLFKQCFDTSPVNYVIQLRLLHACELLRETSASVGEIAYDVGFKDSNYFTRQFKQIIGRTPTQYRRTMQFADPLHISEMKRKY